MGLLATNLCRGTVRHAEYRAARSGPGADRRLAPIADTREWQAVAAALRGNALTSKNPGHATGRDAHGLAAARPRRYRGLGEDAPPGFTDRSRPRPSACSPGGGAWRSGPHAGRKARRDWGGARSGSVVAGSRRVAHRTVRQGPGDGRRRFAAGERCRAAAAGAGPARMVLAVDVGTWSGGILP